MTHWRNCNNTNLVLNIIALFKYRVVSIHLRHRIRNLCFRFRDLDVVVGHVLGKLLEKIETTSSTWNMHVCTLYVCHSIWGGARTCVRAQTHWHGDKVIERNQHSSIFHRSWVSLQDGFHGALRQLVSFKENTYTRRISSKQTRHKSYLTVCLTVVLEDAATKFVSLNVSRSVLVVRTKGSLPKCKALKKFAKLFVLHDTVSTALRGVKDR